VRYAFFGAFALLFVSIIGCVTYPRASSLPPPVRSVPASQQAAEPLHFAAFSNGLLNAAQDRTGALKPITDVASPIDVAREIQSSLRHLRCYSGPATGEWDAATRYSVCRIVSRANMRLPVDRPDPALLALIKAQSAPCDQTACQEPTCTGLSKQGLASEARGRRVSIRAEDRDLFRHPPGSW
jgi:hypothetical protein